MDESSHTEDRDELMLRAATLAKITARHHTNQIFAGPIVSMLLPVTKSRIVIKNRGVAHCFRLEGLSGLFRKDNAETLVFGRYFCDMVKNRYSCEGFFTTDEIPKYGLTGEHKSYISYHAEADMKRDITVLTLYTRSLAFDVRELLLKELSALLAFQSGGAH